MSARDGPGAAGDSASRIEHWRRVNAALERLESLDGEARAQALAALDDAPAVRRDVLRALDEHAVPAAFLDAQALSPEPGLAVGMRIGPFELVRPIASGGMGTVYEALQDTPRRSVALKLLSTGLADERARRRFEIEAEVLAQLRHPGVAQVHGAGIHRPEGGGPGIPWFAMELVPGARDLLAFAREEALDVRARLELFVEICGAVEAGHRRGVLHRDLKPSNLLVDEDGRPRVIDFGVARVGAGDGRGGAALTHSGELLGTLPYMSPEQFSGRAEDVDARSDVYALGVVLYELLCDGPPYDVPRDALLEAARVVREVNPRPPRSLRPELDDELAWILLRTLEKEPERRYASVASLREDLQRHLRHEPVEAGPPSRIYRAGKFVRRHRLLVGVSLLLLASLVAGTVVSTTGFLSARRNLALMREEVLRTDRVNELFGDLFRSVTPLEQGRDVRVVALLDRARENLQRGLEQDPVVAASLQRSLASAYFGLGLYAEALELARPALAFERERLGPDAARVLDLEWQVLEARYRGGDFERVEADLRELIRRCDRALGPLDPASHNGRWSLALLLYKLERLPEAVRVMREALAELETVQADDPRRLGLRRSFLAFVLTRTGARAEAEALALRAHADLDERYGGDDYATLIARGNLAKAWFANGRYAEAAEILRALEPPLRAWLGDDHPACLANRAQLAECAHFLGERAEAERLGTEVLDRQLELLGPQHPDTINSLTFLGTVLQAQGRGDQAGPLFELALEHSRALFGDDDRRTLANRMNLARVRVGQRRLAGLVDELRDVIARVERLPGEPDSLLMTSWSSLGDALQFGGQLAEAEAAYARAVSLAEAVYAEGHPFLSSYRIFRARTLVMLERDAEAEPLLRAVIAELEAQRPDDVGLRFARESLAILEARKPAARP